MYTSMQTCLEPTEDMGNLNVDDALTCLGLEFCTVELDFGNVGVEGNAIVGEPRTTFQSAMDEVLDAHDELLKRLGDNNCPFCRSEIRRDRLDAYPYTESGLSNVALEGVFQLSCACGELDGVEIPSMDQLHRELVRAAGGSAIRFRYTCRGWSRVNGT